MTASPNLTSAALAPAFADAVHDAQSCFRVLMQAMARPGTLQAFDAAALVPEAPLPAALAAAALTLCDFDTPIWLDATLAANPAVAGWLRFHTGAPITSDPAEAAFAFVARPESLPALAGYAQGTLEYPDRSTMLILAVENGSPAPQVRLSGPGVQSSTDFAAAPLPPRFWPQMMENHRRFPRGVDVIFAAPAGFAAVPRSTDLTILEA
ncbi:phosphonate C-P lyase system protein PhnH [Roseibium aestuarii]|uniref:Phosphonate C-P lyase system protein PhnH n=1 Tax=Roseibium aestuarii TaxID=2600299 RepID=A0ABW4JZK0_9HYPH|nr:phosphonate C-P lyase system protein PhnH [Roseibium aestuarii]